MEKYQGYVEREITVTLPLPTMMKLRKYLESDESLLLCDAVEEILRIVVCTYFDDLRNEEVQ